MMSSPVLTSEVLQLDVQCQTLERRFLASRAVWWRRTSKWCNRERLRGGSAQSEGGIHARHLLTYDSAVRYRACAAGIED
jgi:hypothetical protein